MTSFENISVILGVVSIALALASFIISLIALSKSSNHAKQSLSKSEVENMISMGNLEAVVAERISRAKKDVGDVSITLSPLSAKKSTGTLTMEEGILLENYKSIFNSSVEEVINTYEDACSKYLDGKIDKVRFKKSYNVEIRRIVEDKNYQPYLNPTTSSYKALLKVYKEWNDPE